MVDGFQGYDKLKNVKRCACYAHIRRYFLDAIPKGSEKDLSKPAAGISERFIELIAGRRWLLPTEPFGKCLHNRFFVFQPAFQTLFIGEPLLLISPLTTEQLVAIRHALQSMCVQTHQELNSRPQNQFQPVMHCKLLQKVLLLS